MNTFRRLAAVFLFAVSACISVAAFAQPAAISADREACITSGKAATPEVAIAACTRLLEALAPGEIASSYRFQSLLNRGVCGNLVPLGSEIL
jgi:hypothetical protein